MSISQIDNRYLLIAIFLFAFAMRFIGTGGMIAFIEDESIHVPAAENFVTSGHQIPDWWHHPPLKHLLLYVSLEIFGDNPYGRKMRNIILGSLTVVLMVLLGEKIFSDRRVAMLAGLFLVIDPVHLLYSMATHEDIIASFFFLVCLYALVRYLEGNYYFLLVAGFSLGLSVSSRWYFLPAIPLLVFFTIYCRTKDEGWSLITVINILLVFSLIPLTVYVLAYYPWFARGYDLYEIVEKQLDNLRDVKSLVRQDMYLGYIDHSSPIQWFLKPIIYGTRRAVDGAFGMYYIYMNNFPVLILTLPAYVYTAYSAFMLKKRYLFLLVAVFVSTYAVPFLIDRPMYLYTIISVLPFAYLVIAFLIVSVLNRLTGGDLFYALIIIVTLLWGGYIYPLIAARWYVPEFIYRPLLILGEIKNSPF